MMGMFPASKQNDLTEWQQKNAVPPIKGADFSKWQEEIGASALPFGLNTFPIQQIGPEADVMLSINSTNCKRYAAKMNPLAKQASEKLEKTLAIDFKDVWQKMEADEVSGSELCSYLDWAYYARVDLKGDMQTYIKIHETACQEYFNSLTQANISVEWAENGIMSNEFMR